MGKPLRILIVVTCPYYFIRGKTLRVHSNVMALHELGHEITIVAYANGTDINVPGIRILRAPRIFQMRRPHKVGPGIAKLFSDFALLYLASKILRKREYDLIVGTDAEGAGIASLLKRKYKIPAVFDIHGILDELLLLNSPNIKRFLGNFPLRFEKWLWQQADALVCNWPQVEKYAKQIVPHIPSYTAYDVPSPNILDFATKSLPVSKEGLKWEKMLTGKRIVVYAGNFEPYQNFELALHGMKRAVSMGLSDTVLLVLGGNSNFYENLSKTLGTEGFTFFTGRVSPEVTTDILHIADVALSLISQSGNTPSKVIHYLVSGCPILACRSPAHSEMLTDGVDAIFCANDPKDFADKLNTLLQDEEKRQRISSFSRKHGMKFTFTSHKKKWAEIIQPFI